MSFTEIRKVALGQVSSLSGGFAFKSELAKNDKTDEQLLPIVKIGNLIRNGNLDLSDVKYYQYNITLRDYLISRNDILVAMTGATLGKVAVSQFEGLLLNQRVARIKADETIVLQKFLQFLLFSPNFYDYCQMTSGGGAQANISSEQLKNFEIFIPPIEEQHRIVKILDLAQSLIEKRKQAISYLDDYIKAVFLDMFGDPVSNPKRIKTLKGEELFRFSSGKFNPTKNLSEEYTFPTYGGNGITGFSQKYLIDYPTIVIGRVGAYCGSVHKIQEKSWVTDNAIFISKFKIGVNLDFLYYQFIFLNFNRFSDFSGQPKITQKPLESTNYLFPDLVDQNKFSEIVQKTNSLKQKMQSQLKELENNFQAQLQRAFRRD